jgi:hypothetical protein
LRLAFESTDLELLGPLLHPDSCWGDDPDLRACRSKAGVLVTSARLLGDGVGGQVLDLHILPGGVVVHHRVTWPTPQQYGHGSDVWQSFKVRDGLIIEISGHDDEQEARDHLG